jgi:DeoR/GlpR family transcriptional regulator of sugar metabolism
MFAKERLDKIIQILYSEGKVVVKELSETFNISEDAIRKDLRYLESLGVLEKTYGGGILIKPIAQNIRLQERNNYNSTAKRVIADKAFDLLKDGETIFLDISSTNMILAEKLAQSPLNITVISNSLDILKILSQSQNIQLICPGGIYYPSMDGFVGSATIEAISNYTVQKSFIGSCGVDLINKGVTTFNVEDGNTKKAIIRAAKEVILVMENKKFFYDGIYKFADLEKIDFIITEKLPSEEIANKLAKNRVKLI